jgi:protein-tyrosine-phosphatase
MLPVSPLPDAKVQSSAASGFHSVRTPQRRISAPELAFALATLALQYGRRKILHALERRRMHRVRRRPALVVEALKSAKTVLVVCHGNIIRSPFAASLLSQALSGRGEVAILSGGLGAVAGRPPHPEAIAAAGRRGIDLSGHAAAPVGGIGVADVDLIFVMDIPQLVELRGRFPNARAKTFLLASLAPDAPLEIGDPVDGDEAVFEACYDHVCRAVEAIVRVRSALAGAPAAHATPS